MRENSPTSPFQLLATFLPFCPDQRAQLVAQASAFLSYSFENARRDIEQAMAHLDALDGTDNKKQYETSEKAIRQVR